MYCLDCLRAEKERDVVGVCHSCGAGVCVEHAAIVPVHLVHIGVILREERVEPPARELLCSTCLAARRAAGRSDAPGQGHSLGQESAAAPRTTPRSHARWRRGAFPISGKHAER